MLILPLTTKSEDPGVNSEYDDISIGLTSRDKKLLVVSMEKDVFALTGKKKAQTKKVDLEQSNPSNLEMADANLALEDLVSTDAENMIDLSQFDLPTIPPVKKAATKKEPTETVTKGNQTLTPAQVEEATKALSSVHTVIVDYKGVGHSIAYPSLYVFNTKNQLITNIEEIVEILKIYNATVGPLGQFSLNNARKIWNSRLNVVSSQEVNKKTKTVEKKQPIKKAESVNKKVVDTIDFESISDAVADDIMSTILTAHPARVKDIANIISKKVSKQEMAKQLYTLFENNQAAKKTIEIKCKG